MTSTPTGSSRSPLAELTTPFPWGVLLISDASSTEPIPSWASAEDSVTATDTALVMRVLHADEGDCRVRVWNDDADVAGAPVFTGMINIASGVAKVSDALGDASAEVAVTAGRHRIEIFADSAVEASAVDVVLTTP